MEEVLERTKPQNLLVLRHAGFVHITGLVLRAINIPHIEIIKPAKEHQRSHWNIIGEMLVAVFENGETWITSHFGLMSPLQAALLLELCPKGKSEIVRWDRDTFLSPHVLIARMNDPYYNYKD